MTTATSAGNSDKNAKNATPPARSGKRCRCDRRHEPFSSMTSHRARATQGDVRTATVMTVSYVLRDRDVVAFRVELLRAVALRAGALLLRAGVLLRAVDFRAVVFRAVVFRAVVFVGADFFAVLRGVDERAAVLVVAAFATARLRGDVFLLVVFFRAGALAAADLRRRDVARFCGPFDDPDCWSPWCACAGDGAG